MRIGLIAMSGVRAWSKELNEAGLSMPGVMERGNVIASLPSLGLLTLAGLTPQQHEVSYHEIRDLFDAPGASEQARTGCPDRSVLPREGPGLAARWRDALPAFDMVAISSMTAQIKDAYAVADAYRARGVTVVLGGLHVTAMPDEAAAHADAIVVGEGEGVWEEVVRDAERGELRARYRAAAPFDLRDAPMPRFELLDPHRYNRLTVQTSRGCPHRCDFCAGSILLTQGYGMKPAKKVRAEVRAIKEIWEKPFIELADDNSFAGRAHAREILEVLREEEVAWFTETDISIAENEELLDAMRDSGCREVLIGLESPVGGALASVELRRDWKLRQFPRYEAAVRAIQSRGIAVNGCFILGLDGHGPDVFDRVAEFAERTGLFDVQITVMTPFPGTPLYARLLAEGRIIEPGAWEKCTLFDVNFLPRNMSVEELRAGLLRTAGRLYGDEGLRKRREAFYANVTKPRRRKAG